MPLAVGFFDGVAGETEAVSDGVIASPLIDLVPEWQQRVDGRFGPVDWTAVTAPAASRRTEQDAGFEPMLSRMLEVLDLDRSVSW